MSKFAKKNSEAINQKFILILWVFTSFGCGTMKPYVPYEDSNGIFRVYEQDVESQKNLVENIKAPEGALRNQDGQLVSTSAQAKNILDKQNNPSELYETLAAHECGNDILYKANLIQKSAVQKINNLNFQGARDDLKLATNECPRLGWISHQYYLEALVAKELGETAVVRTKLEDFLNYASAVEPRGFYSVDYDYKKDLEVGIKIQQEELAFYRLSARKYLAGEITTLSLSKSDLSPKYAMMYPNNPFRPGGNNTPASLGVPVFGYSSITGSVFGISIYKSWGKYSVLPTIITSSVGNSYGLQLWQSLYESDNRDTNINAKIYGSTWKELNYTLSNGIATSISVVREGFNYGGGLGVTRRFFLPSLGVSSEIVGEQNTSLSQFSTLGSFYGFYDFARGFDFFSGWVRNQPIIGVSIVFVKIGYNPSDKSIVTFFNGLIF